MSMLRQDPLTGRWVIMAAGRSARPNEFRLMKRDLAPGAHCPFCPGHEDSTTREILALGRGPADPANGPGWRMRVFPNMYPALRPESGPPSETTAPELSPEFFPVREGVGSHEVVVYSPDHGAGLDSLDPAEWIMLLEILRDRSVAMARLPRQRYVSPFCNHGPEAGATLAHPHMQIIGTPEVPSFLVDKAVRFAEHRQGSGGCLLCDLLEAELRAEERVIHVNERWTALAPWASRFPWEMLLVPTVHGTGLTGAAPEDLESLAETLAFVLGRLTAIHGDPSLNLVIHSAPLALPDGEVFGDARLDDLAYSPAENFHWHLEILPRLSRPAGFEVGTGFTINSVIPEEAARRLRAGGP